MSPLLRFNFWEPVFFNTEDASFPRESSEEGGCFAGISENVDHDVTFKILNSSTNKIINSSNVRSTSDKESHNLRANPLTSPEVITLL